MNNTKIATCCYCGTRAALVLTGRDRHELACASCGAPLHDLKMLPKDRARGHKEPLRTGKYGDEKYGGKPSKYDRKKPKKVKKKKSFKRRAFEEIFDVIEDIFD
ncbi:MAG: hypothetical protein AAGI10_04650 [Pseudomonadota bacterium]